MGQEGSLSPTAPRVNYRGNRTKAGKADFGVFMRPALGWLPRESNLRDLQGQNEVQIALNLGLSPRMGLFVGLFEPLFGHMRVYLGGGKGAMAQNLLDCT